MNCHLEVTAENFNELFEIEANVTISKVQQCSPPSFIWIVCSQSLFEMTNHYNQSEVEYQSKISRIIATVLSTFSLFHAISVTIWSGVNSDFDWRYSSQVFQSLGGSEDPGWTFMFLIKPCRCVMAHPLFDNQAERKVMASEHFVGGAKRSSVSGCLNSSGMNTCTLSSIPWKK